VGSGTVSNEKTLTVYLSDQFPVADQLAGAPCSWCGKPLGQHPHARGVSCMQAHTALSEADVISRQLRSVADMLQGKACVFGEEPLQGALDRLRLSLGQLEKLVVQRNRGAFEQPAGGSA